jgi:SHS2 domain-containing protein
MKKYEQIDVSGDAGLIIRGKDLEDLFVNAASGMSELITETATIRETEEKQVTVVSDNNEGLLVQWLNELIFLFDAHGFIGKEFRISIEKHRLKGRVSGGTFNPEINESRLLIKAATYNELSIIKGKTGWEARVIFDI